MSRLPIRSNQRGVVGPRVLDDVACRKITQKILRAIWLQFCFECHFFTWVFDHRRCAVYRIVIHVVRMANITAGSTAR